MQIFKHGNYQRGGVLGTAAAGMHPSFIQRKAVRFFTRQNHKSSPTLYTTIMLKITTKPVGLQHLD